jgi:hypothetical protein
MSAFPGYDRLVELASETRDIRATRERRLPRVQSSQSLTRVPLLDWPADLFAKGAAIVELFAEDCSTVWYGGHIEDVPI